MKIIKLEAEENKNHKNQIQNYFYLYFRNQIGTLEFQTRKFLKQLCSIKANQNSVPILVQWEKMG